MANENQNQQQIKIEIPKEESICFSSIWEFLVSPGTRLSLQDEGRGGPGSISGWGAKIQRDMWCDRQKKKR